jgi:hypothetical protein
MNKLKHCCYELIRFITFSDEDSRDERLRKRSIVFYVFVWAIWAELSFVFNLLTFFSSKMWEHFFSSMASCITGVVIIVFLICFIKRYTNVCVMIINVSVLCLFFTWYITTKSSLIFGNILAYTIIIPYTSLLFIKNFKAGRIVFFIIWIIVIGYQLIHELIFTNYDYQLDLMKKNFVPISKITSFVNQYLSPFIIIITFFYITNKSEKHVKYTYEIAKAISNLDIENPQIKKLIKKDDRNLSEGYIILKSICGNIKSYLPFIPDHLKSTTHTEGEFDSIYKGKKEKDIPVYKEVMAEFGDDNVKELLSSDCSNNSSSSSSINSKPKSIVSEVESLKNEHVKKKPEKKKITVAIIIIKHESHKLEIADSYNYLIDVIEPIVKKTKGVIDTLNSNFIKISWGNVKKCVSHEKKATVCLTKIKNFLKNNKTKIDNKLNIKMFLFSCKCITGSIGNDEFKRNIIISIYDDIILKIRELYNSFYIPIIALGNVIDQIRYITKYEKIDTLLYKESQVDIFLIIEKKHIDGNQEWLYEIGDQLKKKDETDKYIDNYWAYTTIGNFNPAIKSLNGYTSNLDIKNMLVKRAENRINVREI